MKVRNKHESVAKVYTVQAETEKFYVTDHVGLDGYFIALQKCYYEPVPTETWRDVTGECDTSAAGMWIKHDDLVLYCPCHKESNEGGYRLRKVQLWKQKEQPWPSMTAQFPIQYDLVDAFIVEKKETS
jgi:hypothetical protein